MKGEQIELRTIIQNLSDTEAKNVTLRLWVEHSDGTRAVTANGTEVSATKDFAIPVWSEKSKFWEKGALEYNGSSFDSGLVNCSLVYTIPQDAILRNGDTIGFEVVDSTTNEVLANDDTETRSYADVTIEYKLEDGGSVPNTSTTVLPMPVGTRVDWQPPQTINGHTLVETKGADSTVGSGGLTITYVYKENEEQPTPPAAKTYTVRYEWGEAPSDKLRPTDDRTYPSEQAARAAADQTFTSASTSNAGKGELAGIWTFSGWDGGTLEDTVVVFRGAWTFTQSTAAVTVTAAPGLPFAVQVSGGRAGAATGIVAQYVGRLRAGEHFPAGRRQVSCDAPGAQRRSVLRLRSERGRKSTQHQTAPAQSLTGKRKGGSPSRPLPSRRLRLMRKKRKRRTGRVFVLHSREEDQM